MNTDTSTPASLWRKNAAAVIVDTQGRVLLGLAPGTNAHWHFPQGGARGDESIIKTLVREIREEVGLSTKDYTIEKRLEGLRYQYSPSHKRASKWLGQDQTYFLLHSTKTKLKPTPKSTHEFIRLEWFPKDKITLELFSPRKRPIVKRVLQEFLGLAIDHDPSLPGKKALTPSRNIPVSQYLVKHGQKVNLRTVNSSDRSAFPGTKEESFQEFDKLKKELQELQKKLFAENKHKLLVIIQAMDTGGKDGCIRNVFDNIDPQGIHVVSFKKPSEEDLTHDFLWRIHKQVPGTGEITIFNRSHYEDIIAVRIKKLLPEARWKKRYKHILDFEHLLADEGTTIVKLFLHISKQEQKNRLESRLKTPEKHWKFHQDDLTDRAKWDEFMNVYSNLIEYSSTRHAPWYIIPADKKWYRNLIVARILVDTLKKLKMSYPSVNFDPSTIVVPD